MSDDSLYPTFKSGSEGKAANTTFEPVGGLTKREYFAGLALQGLLSNQLMGDSALHDSPSHWLEDISDSAVKFADSTIKRLNEEAL